MNYGYVDIVSKKYEVQKIDLFSLVRVPFCMKYFRFASGLENADIILALNCVGLSKYDYDIVLKCKSHLVDKKKMLKDMHLKIKEKKKVYDYTEIDQMGYNSHTSEILKYVLDEEIDEDKNVMSELSREIYFLNWYIDFMVNETKQDNVLNRYLYSNL